jgi:hypothetical protein
VDFLKLVNKREANLDLAVLPDAPMVATVTTPTIFGSGAIPASTR